MYHEGKHSQSQVQAIKAPHSAGQRNTHIHRSNLYSRRVTGLTQAITARDCCQSRCVLAFCGGSENAVTRWCQKQLCFRRSSLFGFFPGRSSQQAQFVLRHLAQRQHCWGGSNKRPWIAFFGFKAANDHVDRKALWQNLQHVIDVPPQPLTVIQNMFSGDAYLTVGGWPY
jgi:hypothetical protein